MRLFRRTESDSERNSYSLIIPIIFLAFVAFIVWSLTYTVDQVVRGPGKLIAQSRVQVIQTVDGGVLAELLVKDGSPVREGQVLARLDKSRFEASTDEILARVNALKAKVARLTAEVSGAPLRFPDDITNETSLINFERTLYERRRKSLADDTSANRQAMALAQREQLIVDNLRKTGDVDQVEVLRAERGLVEARAKLSSRQNQYFEQAGQELVKAQDDLAQNLAVLAQRQDLLASSELKAVVPGVVKNISVTTIGAVLKPGEELMQVVPTNDNLFVEVKISPKDIADVRIGMPATIRLDAYDSSVSGVLEGSVTYVSADSITEKTPRGDESFYIARLKIANGSRTTTGKKIDIISGMTSQVDIKIKDRSVFSFLLKPITKIFSESLGER